MYRILTDVIETKYTEFLHMRYPIPVWADELTSVVSQNLSAKDRIPPS